MEDAHCCALPLNLLQGAEESCRGHWEQERSEKHCTDQTERDKESSFTLRKSTGGELR